MLPGIVAAGRVLEELFPSPLIASGKLPPLIKFDTAAEWIKANASTEFAREVAEALPFLPVGTAFLCSAALDIGKRVEVRPRHTFNSGATPAPGERKTEPVVLASVDIERLGRELASSARRAQVGIQTSICNEQNMKNMTAMTNAINAVPRRESAIIPNMLNRWILALQEAK